MSSRYSSWELRRYCIARNERSSQFLWIFNTTDFVGSTYNYGAGQTLGLLLTFGGRARMKYPRLQI